MDLCLPPFSGDWKHLVRAEIKPWLVVLKIGSVLTPHLKLLIEEEDGSVNIPSASPAYNTPPTKPPVQHYFGALIMKSTWELYAQNGILKEVRFQAVQFYKSYRCVRAL